jgi:hypothetical protein
MPNELTKSQQNLVSIINESGITNLIEPLVKEIYLFDTYIAGTSFVEDKDIFSTLRENDHLILRRDVNNKFDEKAILVLTQSQQKLGFIPRKDNEIFSRLLDAGKLLTASIKEINLKGDFYTIKINIYLVDF